MQQSKGPMLHFIKSTLFSLDLRTACPNWVSLALYKCNAKANVTLELCVAIFPTEKQRQPSWEGHPHRGKRKTKLSWRKTKGRENYLNPCIQRYPMEELPLHYEFRHIIFCLKKIPQSKLQLASSTGNIFLVGGIIAPFPSQVS